MIRTRQAHKLVGLSIVFAMLSLLLIPTITHGQEDTDTDTDRGRPARIIEKIAERKANAKIMVEEKRAAAQQKSEEARTAACERRQEKLTSAMNGFSSRVTKHVATFDSVYSRVQGFYDKEQLTVSNYDELNGAVASAQSAVLTEAGALSGLNVEIDCEDPDVASVIAAFRDSAAAARESLKTYRAALVSLVSSLRASAAEESAQNNSDKDSDADSSTDDGDDADATEPDETTEGEN